MFTLLDGVVSFGLGFVFAWWAVIILPRNAQRSHLRASILKWEAIAYSGAVDDGTEDCKLCDMYLQSSHLHDKCHSCPVHAYSGKILCQDTPYDDWVAHFGTVAPRCVNDDKQKKAAVSELQFLKQLLATSEQTKWWHVDVNFKNVGTEVTNK